MSDTPLPRRKPRNIPDGPCSECERELSAVTRERDEAYERGLQEGRIDLEKIVRKWDSECLDPPEVEGLRDYAMLDGERLETLWRALELSLAREMQTARERDEARALNAEWAEKAATWMASPEAAQRLQGYRDLGQQVAQAQNERDALRAEVERERMRLVACGVVALANTPTTAAKARDMHPDYWSASCADVARMVDEQMRLRAEVERLTRALKLVRDQDQGCGGNVTEAEAWRSAQSIARAALQEPTP